MLPLPARGVAGDVKSRRHRGLGYAVLLGLFVVGSLTWLRSEQSGEAFLSPLPAPATPRSPDGVKVNFSVPASGESFPVSASALVLSAAGLAAAMSLTARERRTSRRAAGDARTKLEELQVGQEVTGKVTRIAKIGVWVDIGTEKDGLIPTALVQGKVLVAGDTLVGLRITELQTGDEPEDRKVRLALPVLTSAPAAAPKAKAKAAPKAAPKAAAAPASGKAAISSLALGSIIEGKVTGVDEKIGIFVDVGVARNALIPARFVPQGEPPQIGAPIKVKIIQIDAEKDRITASTDLQAPVVEAVSLPKLSMEDVKAGKELVAVVLRTDAKVGIFLDFGGPKPAFCRLTQLEREFSAYKIGDKVKITVLSVDQEGKVLATMRPLSSTIKVGQALEGTVKLVADFGIFFDAGYSADVLAPDQALAKEKASYTQGTVVDLIVTKVDGDKVTVSTKSQSDLGTPISKLRAGTPTKGTIKSITKVGLFIDIGSMKDALLKSSLLPKPLEAYTKGDVLTDLFIVKINEANMEIELGSLQKPAAGSNAARTAEAASMKIGTVVTGKVTGISEVGVFVDIGSDRDALYGNNQLEKPKSEYQVGEVLTGLVITQNEQIPRRLAVSSRPTSASYTKGQAVSGIVTKKLPNVGVFIDIGASSDALLLMRGLEKAFEEYTEGERISDMTVFDTDNARNRITVVQKESMQGASSGKSVGEFGLGQQVTGIVKQIKEYGLFVDIGLGKKDALLPTSFVESAGKRLSEFKANDQIQVFVARTDAAKGNVTVCLQASDVSTPTAGGTDKRAGGGSSSAMPGLHPKFDGHFPDGAPYELWEGERWLNGNIFSLEKDGTDKGFWGTYRLDLLDPDDMLVPWFDWEKRFPGFVKFSDNITTEYHMEGGPGPKFRTPIKWKGIDNINPADIIRIPIPAHLRKPDAALPDLGPKKFDFHDFLPTWNKGLPMHIHTKYRQAPLNTPNWTRWEVPESVKAELKAKIEERALEREMAGLPPIPIKPVGKVWTIPEEVVRQNPWRKNPESKW